MHVKMRNALADAIVDGHEGSLGFHALRDSAGEKLDIQKERADQRVGQVRKRLDVVLYDEERNGRQKAGDDREMRARYRLRKLCGRECCRE